MKLSDAIDNWDDPELELCLESARDKYIKFKRTHPTQADYKIQDLKSTGDILAIAKQIHQKNKSKSMELVALESYQFDLGIDQAQLDEIMLLG